MNIVPRQVTPASSSEAMAAVKEAYISVMGHEPELSRELPLLMALVWLETGRGQSLNNHNVGNISASPNYNGNAWLPPWFEVDDTSSERNIKLHEAMLNHEAPSAFRAYDSLDDGAHDFMVQLNRTFPEVLEAAADGSPEGFRNALAQAYSKDYRNTPPKTFESLAKEFGFVPNVGGKRTLPVLPVVAFIGVAGILAYAAKKLFSSPNPDSNLLHGTGNRQSGG